MYLSTRTDLSLLNSNLNNKNKFHNIEGVWVADITLHYCETVKYFELFICLINNTSTVLSDIWLSLWEREYSI